jgi:ribosomal protein L37AE/L43A
MEDEKTYKCNTCGYIWKRREGYGFDIAYYHCDRCGEERIVNAYYSVPGEKEPSKIPCICGGYYKLNGRPICPHCKSKEVIIIEQ